ncbi:MAG: UvrD-helicase domain-containing protein [Myxococcaceae bacterium]|nr:UvrD-helicase domain-containing protein [Myxococcaceae bacterium]
MTAHLDDATIRHRLEHELDTTFVVEAAAGTGKTTILVSRVLSLIRTGTTRLSQIIAVTFTEKAAGEMKLRIRERIEQARNASPTEEERRRLEVALSELEGARIGTIHSLCADLLRERPIEAGVDPLFQVASDDEARALLETAFAGWFARAVSKPSVGIRRFLRRTPRRGAPTSRKQLRDAAWRLIEHRDFDAPWRRDTAFRRDEEIDALIPELERFARAIKANTTLAEYPRKMFNEVPRFIDDLFHREKVAPRDHDGLEAQLRELSFQRVWKMEVYGKRNAELIALRDEVAARLFSFVERSDADLAALLRTELAPVADAYQAQKAAAGRLDFTDLLLRTRDLLRHQREARVELQRRFTHLFVDEFQDTDPLQADILLLLAAEDPDATDTATLRTVPGKLFVVGDPKQSIYAFRRADVALYQRIKARLVAQGATLLYLSKSFRSVPEIQEAVNAAFAPAMGDGSEHQAKYVPLQRGREDAPVEQPAVIALPVPYTYSDSGKLVNYRIEASLPDAVGAFVDFLVNQSQWKVTETDRPGERVPLQPRHICILFRRFQAFGEDVTRPYVAALEARRVPHVLVGGRSFHARDEVLALRNALAAIEWPDDELAVFATLRGPYFALQDDALLAFRAAFGRMHPLRTLDVSTASPAVKEVAEALAALGALHRRRNRVPIADTVSQFLELTRAHAGLAFWTAGEQALANVLRVVELARRFEAAGATSFRAFVDHLHDEAEESEAEEARVVEEGTEGVRLMTVHRAKGLEFPVVILADLTANAVHSRPSRHVDTASGLWAQPLAGCIPHELLDHAEEALARDREEAVRLAYVAATRARDLLVVPAVADQPHDGWLGVLNPVLYPKPGTGGQPKPPPNTPVKGRTTTLDRPVERFVPEEIVPGLHTPCEGSHGVVWWDPATLDLQRETFVDSRREQVLIPKNAENEAKGREEYARWEAAREARLRQGATPSMEVKAVREVAQTVAAPRAFPVVTLPRDGERPTGRRFGALVHAALAKVPLDAKDEDVRRHVETQARLLGATPDEVAAATKAVSRALGHELWQRARACAPGEVWREVPVMLRRPDGSWVEGEVDFVLCERDGALARWTVIELKTDAVARGELPAAYHAQLELYVEAISKSVNAPADGMLVLV